MSRVKLDIDDRRLLELLKDLIRIDSVNPSLVPGGRGEGDIAGHLSRYFDGLGLEVKRQDLGDGRQNVIGILRGTGGGKTLMLNGHTDTVGLEGMTIAPLEPEYRDGQVYGRGSLDMKGGLAAMVAATEAVARSGFRLKGDLLVTCVADEEYASLGTEAIVREYRAHGAIVCEPSGLDIVVAHKGFAWVNVDISGVASHGSLPEEGVDAIVKAGKFLVALEEMAETTLTKKNHPLLGPPSVHASTIHGGTELSTYPAFCRVQVERRTIPGEDRDTVIGEIEGLIASLASADPNFRARHECFFCRPPFEVPSDEPLLSCLIAARSQVLGEAPELVGSAAWLDSAILQASGIPTVIFGPCGQGAHSAVESVDFQSVLDAAMVLARAIVGFSS